MCPTRRSFIALMGRGSAALAFGILPRVSRPHPGPLEASSERLARLDAVVSLVFETSDERDVASRLGREVPSLVLAEFERSFEPWDSERLAIDGAGLRAHLTAQCEQDLRSGRICSVEGWVLSHSEAALLRATRCVSTARAQAMA